MKVIFSEREFFNRLTSNLEKFQLPPLSTGQEDILRSMLYEGLDLKVQAPVEVECGALHIIAINLEREKLADGEVARKCDFSMPGFPIEANVTKVSVSFDATSTEPAAVDMTIFPFRIPYTLNFIGSSGKPKLQEV